MKPIFLDNDYEICWPMTRKNTATGLDEPASGLTGVIGKLSATDGGAAIHATLSITLAERASTPGEYFGILQGDDLRTQLASLTGQVVYECIGDGVNEFICVARKVLAHRRADV